MLIDVQFLPSSSGWAGLLQAATTAEELGYGRVWLFDHLAASSLRADAPMLECCTTLGALAAATSTIGLGTLVANVANRYPAVLALAVATAQDISGGRVIAGIGAGAAPGSRWAAEHEAAGITLLADEGDRHMAVAHQIEAIRNVTRAPVIVGVNSVALAGLAGRYADGVNVRLTGRSCAEFISAAREASGDRPFEISAFTVEYSAETHARALELGVERVVMVTPPERFVEDRPPAA